MKGLHCSSKYLYFSETSIQKHGDYFKIFEIFVHYSVCADRNISKYNTPCNVVSKYDEWVLEEMDMEKA